MHRSLAAAATALALLAVTATAQARTLHAKVVSIEVADITCYATVPVEGRGIVCSSRGLKAGPQTHGLDPVLSLQPTGRAVFGGRGDYGGYAVKRPAPMIPGDRWIWHGISCQMGHDALTCRNPQGHGFILGQSGWSRV